MVFLQRTIVAHELLAVTELIPIFGSANNAYRAKGDQVLITKSPYTQT